MCKFTERKSNLCRKFVIRFRNKAEFAGEMHVEFLSSQSFCHTENIHFTFPALHTF